MVNPKSFGHTVENIFHLSFLVKDGLVKIFLNEAGLPVIEPVKDVHVSSQNTNGGDPETNHQVLICLCYDTRSTWLHDCCRMWLAGSR